MQPSASSSCARSCAGRSNRVASTTTKLSSKRPRCTQVNVLRRPRGFPQTSLPTPAIFPGRFKQQMEIRQGKQIIEFPELAGLSRNARERNKANLTRAIDRARMAYAHYAKTDTPRHRFQSAPSIPGLS